MRTQPRAAITLMSALFLTSPTVSGADTLLVANKSDGTVDLLDLASTESIALLPTDEGPHEIEVSDDGSLAVISNYGSRDRPGGTLTVIDVTRASVARTIDLGEHRRPHGLAWLGEGSVAVTAEGSGHLLVVDVERGRVASAVETGQEISHMVTVNQQGDRAFVANIGSGTVTAIDLEQSAKIVDIATGEGAEGIATTPDGAEVWVTNRAADTLSVIDPATLGVRATLPCAGFPIRIAFSADGGRALVSAARTGEVVVFDTRRRRELQRRQLDLGTVPDASRRLFGDQFGDSPVPVGLVISPADDRAWVAATQADIVVVVDPRDLRVMGLLKAGHEPDGMAFSPVTPRIAARGNS